MGTHLVFRNNSRSHIRAVRALQRCKYIARGTILQCLCILGLFSLVGTYNGVYANSTGLENNESTAPDAPRAGQIRIKGVLDSIEMHNIDIKRVDHADLNITLDGLAIEADWQQAAPFDNMQVSVPATGEKGSLATEIRMLASERGLFVAAKMFQPQNSFVRRMTERDQFIDRDTIGITLDTTGNGSFAYWFIVALGDSVMDGKVLPERRYSNDWDGPWLSKTAVFEGGWSAEMFFPWSMMSLGEAASTRDEANLSSSSRNIGFAFSRQISHTNERYQWPGHSQSSPQFVTALNTMQVDDVKPRKLLAAIPYISTTLDEARGETEARVGVDLTWKPSPKLEFTAALNPDFGAVEADDVVVNLTALETFFPEKRLFFLEGNEVFETTNRASFGNAMRIYNAENFATTSRRIFVTDNLPTPISLLNTRRIGGTASQVQLGPGEIPLRGEQDQPTDLLGAVKLNGSIGNLRYGALTVLEDDIDWRVSNNQGGDREIDEPGRDFSVARMIYEVTPNNRYSIGYLGTHVDGPIYDATVHGIDAHFANPDGRWAADLQLMRSDVDDITGEGALLDLSYRPDSNNRHTVRLDYFDESIDINDLGFLRRNDYAGAQYIYTYVQPKSRGIIQSNQGAITLDQRYNISEGQIVESAIYWRNTTILPGRNTLRTALAYFPERFEDVDSRGNGAYEVEDRIWWDVLWSTDAAAIASYSFGIGAWQEHLGDWTYQVKAGVSLKPTDNFSADIDLSYKRRDGWLVYQGADNFGAYHGTDWQPSVKLTWFLAASHQLRLSMQWAGVRVQERGFFAVPAGDGALQDAARTLPNHDFTVSLLTTQLRYRWEIAPLTDFYIVYNRGNRLALQETEEFNELFSNSFQDPLVDALIVKLRWRFSN